MGAHAVLGNGACLARVGTAAVSLSAFLRRVPVMVCCQTFKFTERVQLDAFVWNELGSPDSLLKLPLSSSSPLRIRDEFSVLNLVYDVTPASHISLVITDIGCIPCSSVPVVLREYRPIQAF